MSTFLVSLSLFLIDANHRSDNSVNCSVATSTTDEHAMISGIILADYLSTRLVSQTTNAVMKII
jgi:hypothetical protein